MDRRQLVREFEDLNIGRSGGQRAPHKPLLLLLTLVRIQRGEPRLVDFASVEEPLTALLEEFGQPLRRQNPNLPFWHLRTDGIWEIEGLPGIEDRAAGDAPSLKELRDGVKGGLRPDLDEALRSDSEAIREVAQFLLDTHFPESTYHEDIAAAVGLDLTLTRAPRDPRFRERVLIAYGFSCAVCGFNLRLKHAPVAIEAAHIKWHQAGGPSVTPNGLALCTMHHKLFDRGAMAIGTDRRIAVSNLVNGTSGYDEFLGPYQGRELRSPHSPDLVPLEEYVAWHVREVFKGGARPV